MNKNLHFAKIVILLAFLLCLNGVKGQLSYKPGYLVTFENDTLFGKIYDGGNIRNGKEFKFKASGTNAAVVYKPTDVKLYRFIDGKYYKSKSVFYKKKLNKYFLNVLVDGEVSLYFDRRDKNNAYYIERDENELVGLSKQDGQLRNVTDYNVSNRYSANTYFVELSFYKDTLQSFFRDSRIIQNAVVNIDYNKKSLIGITTAYLDESCQGAHCINYTRKLSESKATSGIYTGVQLSQLTFVERVTKELDEPKEVKETGITSKIITSIPVGFFYNLPISGISERLSLQAELFTSKLSYEEDFVPSEKFSSRIEINARKIGLPLMVKYDFPKGKMTPSVGFGREFDFLINSEVTVDGDDDLYLLPKQKGGWFFELGLDYELNEEFSVFSNLRFQTYSNFIVTEENRSASFVDTYDNLYHEQLYKTYSAAILVGIRF